MKNLSRLSKKDRRFLSVAYLCFLFEALLWMFLVSPNVHAQGGQIGLLGVGGPSGLSLSPGWTYLQDVNNNADCSGATTCTFGVAFPATTAGSVWVAALFTGNNVTMSSVSGGGGTWTHCPTSCHNFTTPSNVDAMYNLTGSSGTTNITVTASANGSGGYGIEFIELLPPSGYTASIDATGSNGSSSCSSCTGVGLTVTGTDAIVQLPTVNNGLDLWNLFSSPYTTTTFGNGIALNTSSGTAPTFQQSGGASTAAVAGLAFKTTAGTFTPPTQVFSMVNITMNPGSASNCSPTCSITIPSTGSGHLLFVQATNPNTASISSISGGGTWVIPSGSNTCKILLTSTNDQTSCAYVLSSTSGVTSLSVTMNTNTVNGYFVVYEVSRSSGSFTLDAQNSSQVSASFHPNGQGLTLSGSIDVLFQTMYCPGGATTLTLYPGPRSSLGNQIQQGDTSTGFLLNSSNGTAPIWINPQNNATAVTGVAFQ
jgi:hypothetical protein